MGLGNLLSIKEYLEMIKVMSKEKENIQTILIWVAILFAIAGLLHAFSWVLGYIHGVTLV